MGLDGQYHYVGGAAQLLVVIDYIAAESGVFFLYFIRHIGYIDLLRVKNAGVHCPRKYRAAHRACAEKTNLHNDVLLNILVNLIINDSVKKHNGGHSPP